MDDFEIEDLDAPAEAIARLKTHSVDLVLTDLRSINDENDYDFSGLEVARHARGLGIPTIIVTAFPSIDTMRLALRSVPLAPMAADYVSKKDGPQAIVDAVNRVLSAQQKPADSPATSSPADTPPAGLHVDLDRKRVWLNGVEIVLPLQQYDLLAHLYGHAGSNITRGELIKVIYGKDARPADSGKAFEGLLARLRVSLGESAEQPHYIISIKGSGVRFEKNPTPSASLT